MSNENRLLGIIILPCKVGGGGGGGGGVNILHPPAGPLCMAQLGLYTY